MDENTPEDLVGAKEIAIAVWRGAEFLDDRTMLVLSLRYGLGGNGEHAYKEIAEIIGVSIERARQILLGGLRALSRKSIIRAAADDVGLRVPPDSFCSTFSPPIWWSEVYSFKSPTLAILSFSCISPKSSPSLLNRYPVRDVNHCRLKARPKRSGLSPFCACQALIVRYGLLAMFDRNESWGIIPEIAGALDGAVLAFSDPRIKPGERLAPKLSTKSGSPPDFAGSNHAEAADPARLLVEMPASAPVGKDCVDGREIGAILATPT